MSKKEENVFTQYKSIYKRNLLEQTIPFWERHSIDREYGGYFTCLTTEGSVFDTDKFIWLQCRQVWTFSKMYQDYGKKENWLELAKHGADFLEKHGRDREGNWYFALDQKGNPLVQPYNIFSDCFAAMAFGQLGKVTGESRYSEIAKETFQNILVRRENPKGKYNKTYPNTRELQNLGLPMILSNLVLELDHILSEGEVQQQFNLVKEKIMTQFHKPELGIILENVGLDGSIQDTFQGRLVNPGHGLETLWFLMDIGKTQGDRPLIEQCVDLTISTLEYGWDKEFGGLFYFLDLKGHPPEQLEWDQKLWWPHIEAMIACLKGYYLTKDERCWDWFVRLHNYTWSHFVDEKYGEWFGYLNREGKVHLELKGGKWKGCFHVPRGLMYLTDLMSMLEERQLKQIGANPLK